MSVLCEVREIIQSSFAENNRTLSNEDMILALVGQFKQLSHEPEKFR